MTAEAEYVFKAILGFFVSGCFFLMLPVCIALVGKTMRKIFLWLIAIAGGLLGFVALVFYAGMWGNTSVIVTYFFDAILFTPIGYLILSAKCSKYNKRTLRVPLKRADKDIKNKLTEIEENGKDTTEYIKSLIREDMKREQV